MPVSLPPRAPLDTVSPHAGETGSATSATGGERPTADRRGRRVHAFLNPNAGAAAGKGEATLKLVADAFARAGIDARVEALSQDPAAFDAAVGAAKRGEVDAIVIGGGDGTVSAAVAAVAGTGIPLGILPLGTLNHFAKDLGIPLEVARAVAVIRAGHARHVDLGEMNGRTFINNSSIGIYPRLVVDRERLQKRRGMRKWPAMWLATFRTLRALTHRRMRVQVEGTSAMVKTPCLFVGNNQYGTHVFELGRRARLDGGELWVYVVRPVGVLGLFRLAFRMALGMLDSERDLIVLKGRSAEITPRPRRTLVALDGEVVVDEAPLRYASKPKALTVFAPPEIPAD